MNRPSFLQGVIVALVLSFFGAALHAALAPVLGAATTLRLLIALLGLGYLLYLIARSPVRTGRVVTVVGWLLAAVATWLAGPPLVLYALVHVALVWLIRSLYLYAGVVPALLDLGLCAAGATAAVGTLIHTGSLFLALWCFFLVQALLAVIPAALGAPRERVQAIAETPFERARRTAEAALKRIYLAQ